MKLSGALIAATLVLGGCASTSQSPDQVIASQIKKEIAQTEGIGGASDVNVQAHKGVVVLSGFIGNEQQKEDAGQAALSIAGVERVFNNIQVNQTSSGR